MGVSSTEISWLGDVGCVKRSVTHHHRERFNQGVFRSAAHTLPGAVKLQIRSSKSERTAVENMRKKCAVVEKKGSKHPRFQSTSSTSTVVSDMTGYESSFISVARIFNGYSAWDDADGMMETVNSECDTSDARSCGFAINGEL